MTTTSAPVRAREATPPRRTPTLAPWVGLGLVLVLVGLAWLVPYAADWDVHAKATRDLTVPPLSATWDPRIGPGTLPAVVLALLAWRYAAALATSLSWARLLVLAYAAGLAWLLTLALVDGPAGISHVLDGRNEYLRTARAVTDVPTMLEHFTGRISLDSAHAWTTHVAGHPPGALLFFEGLVRLGLGGSFAAGLVVVAIAASTAPAVLVTLRTLEGQCSHLEGPISPLRGANFATSAGDAAAGEVAARRAAPFLVFVPAAVWMAVSADAMFAAVAAWGLAALAVAATTRRRTTMVGASLLAGLLLGLCTLLSYGLPLLGCLALAILYTARRWSPLPLAAAAALIPVLVIAGFGFDLWAAYPVLRERYWAGIAHDRPASYWLWGNLAALTLSAGPALGPALGAALGAVKKYADRTVTVLVTGAAAAIVIADVSLMSKAEVERIWLPFTPWLLLATAALPNRWRRPMLALQLATALLVQHLLATTW